MHQLSGSGAAAGHILARIEENKREQERRRKKHWSYKLSAEYEKKVVKEQFALFKQKKIKKGILKGLKARGIVLGSLPLYTMYTIVLTPIYFVILFPGSLVGGAFFFVLCDGRKAKKSFSRGMRSFLYGLSLPYILISRFPGLISPAFSTYVMKAGDIDEYWEKNG